MRRMRAGLVALAWLAAAAGGGRTACAAPLEAGADAPPIKVDSWGNVPDGKGPTPESLKGQVVLLEFWETQCGPCVRTMPRVQELYESYGPRGLTVLTVSWEAPGIVAWYAKGHGLTMPMGSDESKALIHAFGIDGYPTTYVVGKDGKIAYRGSPSGVEPAVEKALGLASSLGALLTEYATALGAKDAAAVRGALERLAEKAAAGFNLKAWAAGAGGAAPPADKPAVPKADGARTLTDYAKACAGGAADKAQAALDALAGGGPDAFDLGAWAREAFARDFPVALKEFQDLLVAGRFDAAVDAIVLRRPSAAVLDAAAKSAPLAVHCSKKTADTRTAGKKGIMVLHWPLGNRFLKDKDLNEAFWHELASNGMATTADRKTLVGIDVGGVMLTAPMLPAWIDRQFGRAIVMEAIAVAKKPNLGKLADDVAKAKASTLKDLQSKYGD